MKKVPGFGLVPWNDNWFWPVMAVSAGMIKPPQNPGDLITE